VRIRDGNIIVCDCGAELNPEITSPWDFIKYVDGVATCANCGSSDLIEIAQKDDICSLCGQPLTN